MSDSVTLPFWLFVVILLFAAITALSHVFIPPVRWFLRRRLERAVARLNRRLVLPIEPFKLLRRQDTILRLSYDPAVIEAVQAHAAETGIREDVAHSTARSYAREIVPSFSASAYFGFATRAARWLSTRLFDVEVSRAEDAVIRSDATVVFVMNHRSNMDYVLVTYLAAERSALAYAVGEWARIWPLSRLLRAMGAYFIRRRSRNPLYRRVLARYVQMAVAGGVTQAIFPEGGLSLDGRVGAPKLGLLSYICDGYDPAAREIVFVPVSLNYDRVLEDNILLAAGREGTRRFRGSFPTATGFALRWLYRRLRGRVRKFGVAAVSFGAPIPLSDYGRDPDVPKLARDIMARIRSNVPVLAGPLVAAALLDGNQTRSEILEAVLARVAACEAAGHFVCLGGPADHAVERMLQMFVLRHMVRRTGEQVEATERGHRVLPFYAAAVPSGDAAPQYRPEDRET
ncbi:glycerol-3-phosphate acyltransferase [Palleronia marisminoris]|uniref:1-acyl-sn-glycerol-3-phosphate acyltransferase n=1 Tax=Palleronia marisminoris TaxID=315423 RepID=UPI0008F446A6|nr:1-acyl-sn-glycerol-3-phosphate acyltransferase [Palleronia marisminoris]SFG46552.1 glycerol-3-phosphate acyltransferase [Palleronia marisminoris]